MFEVLIMNKFVKHTGVAAPLIRNNIDTDAIIPSREMKTVSKLGLSDGLFASWRYLDEKSRTENPEFVLNLPNFKAASVLLSGHNFGCGSSREHAVWALKEYGIRCIIAESFGTIFYRNSIANGLLPISLEQTQIQQLAGNSIKQLTIDLAAQMITCGKASYHFQIAGNDKLSLLEGLDPITATLQYQSLIDDFSTQDRARRPWLY